MKQLTLVPVKNLSRPGAQVAEGPNMTEKVTADDRVVLVESGRNDLFRREPLMVFEKNLEATLSNLAMPGRTIVMFELPLLPYEIASGQVQRRLAAKYGVWLIPEKISYRCNRWRKRDL
jgi:hypothetical protein